MNKSSHLLISISILILFLVPSCNPATDLPAPTNTLIFNPIQSSTPNLTPTQSPSPTFPPIPTATPIPLDTGWEELQPGLRRRIINIVGDDRNHLEKIYILRMEPNNFVFNVAYDPNAKTIEEWQLETNALIVLNGGFFRIEDSQFIPNGLTIIDGDSFGISYGPFAGMFIVKSEGPEVRWLDQKPYDPNEAIIAGLQSFPVLVKPGGELGFPEASEDYVLARRTVLGMTKDDYLLFIVAHKGHFSLHQFSSYLVESDFDLEIALNLDGGPSSGIILSSPFELVPSFVPLPLVITVHNR